MRMWTISKMGMRTFLCSLLPPLTILLIGILGLLSRSALADPGSVTLIVLTPSDVGSLSPTNFTTLPTDDPTVFGFGLAGAPVQKVDFDFDPDGNPIPVWTPLTDEYSSIGVLMNGIFVRPDVAGGAASPPNATILPPPEDPPFQEFTFTVPVLEAGIINTTPDAELYEFFDENGNLLASVIDPGNASIDTFVGAKVSGGPPIKTFRITNIFFAMELDELIFTPLAAIPVTFLVIDEDSIDNGNPPNFFSDFDVNDGIAEIGLRTQLHFFAHNVGERITLYTGEVGDEGWFALKTIPTEWVDAGPTADGLRNYLLAGPGLGTGDDPEALLDKVPDVIPLRATGLKLLEGQKVCAVVYDSDVSINYGPLNGSLKGANLGTVAFQVLEVRKLQGFSSSSLPEVDIKILDAENVCEGVLTLLTDAPEPISSSEPFDIEP